MKFSETPWGKSSLFVAELAAAGQSPDRVGARAWPWAAAARKIPSQSPMYGVRSGHLSSKRSLTGSLPKSRTGRGEPASIIISTMRT
jgi:hypothetical protein